MHTLSTLLPGHPAVAARATYVLDWLCAHPYAGGRLRWLRVADAHAADLDARALTSRTSWLASRVRAPAFAAALAEAPAVRVRHDREWVYGVGPRRQPDLLSGGRYAFDWIATLFAWLSRGEEQARPAHSLAPPPARRAWLVRHGLEREPRADRLAAALLSAWGIPPLIETSTVRLTHDLDHVRLWQRPWTPLRYAAYAAKRGAGGRAYARAARDVYRWWQRTARDPYDNPDQTLRSRGGTLYLLLGRHARQDGGADKTDVRLRGWIDAARDRGYDLGLHPSYTTPDRPSRLHEEVDRFVRLTGARPRQTRQHFLRWDWSRTPRQLASAGLTVDSTLGYRDRLGFRCGTSFPYALYDFDREAAGPLREWPLAAMDTAWMEVSGYDPRRCAADWADFAARNRLGAALVLDVHNSTFYHARLAGIDLEAWYRYARDRPVAPSLRAHRTP